MLRIMIGVLVVLVFCVLAYDATTLTGLTTIYAFFGHLWGIFKNVLLFGVLLGFCALVAVGLTYLTIGCLNMLDRPDKRSRRL